MSINGDLTALKAHFRPFPIEVQVESGDTVILWSLPMRYDFYGEKTTRDEISKRLKESGLEGPIFDDALNYELIINFCKEYLVKAPKDPAKGFEAGDLPEPLFKDGKEVSETLPYSVILGAHRKIQQKGFGVVGEVALKNL